MDFGFALSNEIVDFDLMVDDDLLLDGFNEAELFDNESISPISPLLDDASPFSVATLSGEESFSTFLNELTQEVDAEDEDAELLGSGISKQPVPAPKVEVVENTKAAPVSLKRQRATEAEPKPNQEKYMKKLKSIAAETGKSLHARVEETRYTGLAAVFHPTLHDWARVFSCKKEDALFNLDARSENRLMAADRQFADNLRAYLIQFTKPKLRGILRAAEYETEMIEKILKLHHSVCHRAVKAHKVRATLSDLTTA